MDDDDQTINEANDEDNNEIIGEIDEGEFNDGENDLDNPLEEF